MPSTFLTAEWKNLIMANYIVEPSVLLPFVPHKTLLDTHNGNVYVSLVGFIFANTRLLGVRIPFHINFEEVNLRFYVRFNEAGNWKRGTVFIKEIVPRAAISFVANNLYNENYSTMPMRHFLHRDADEIKLGYHWKYKDKWNRLEATVDGTAIPMLIASEEAFIAEHYFGYSRQGDTATFEYEVLHSPWKVFPVRDYSIDCDFKGLYGSGFSNLKNQVPNSVFVAEGSPVSILHKKKL